MVRQVGFFDVDDRLKRLSVLGDQLEAYGATVDFEIFRSDLEVALAYGDGAKGGRPPFDPVMMLKILIIQAQNNLGDDRTEFLINDRLSFMRFLGLSLGDRVPDAKTIWLFRERLKLAGAMDRLFGRFDQALAEAGYIAMSGQIVDATLVAAPKQRNTEAEKAEIKAGGIPKAWKEKPAKLRQKDRDARWTVKFSKAKPRADGSKPVDIAIPTFGYQNHVAIDHNVSGPDLGSPSAVESGTCAKGDQRTGSTSSLRGPLVYPIRNEQSKLSRGVRRRRLTPR